MCVRYIVRRKCGILAASKRLQAEGRLIWDAAAELHISTTKFLKWAVQGIGEINALDKICRSKKKAVLTDLVGQLKAIENALLRYIFKLCEQRITVNTFMVVLRAAFILPEFRVKSFTARSSSVKCILVNHSFSYPMGMPTLQRPQAKVESKAFDF